MPIAAKSGCAAHTLNDWVKKTEVDSARAETINDLFKAEVIARRANRARTGRAGTASTRSDRRQKTHPEKTAYCQSALNVDPL